VRHHVLVDERIRTAVAFALERAIEEQRIVGSGRQGKCQQDGSAHD